ncbi:hydantoinase B/oxoprolinase family protein [Salicibibacter cibarius]|uniref:Hydantoinase B/oxoprolinase family protein n=1 Tax=Salicibibacter cibarius TaxID=2743000 RepID=A0A7T6Z6F7_9BACI|nr:hydantoinase B/oxoprolinase family protein [Salicibibacter cibarius]QQK77806.1 hydantoinase B/oxoprolinase family protein [Salicibibacter cibarius]
MSVNQSLPDYVREHNIDQITLDIIENALQNIRYEMDRVLVTTAVSPIIREQEDQFPLITDKKGRMVVGQFGSAIDTILEHSSYEISDLKDGDVIALNDPYMCEGTVSHLPDFLILKPIFFEDKLIGYSSQWGNLMDVGGKTEGSIPISARSVLEEGIRMPPVMLYKEGTLNEELLKMFTHNTRLPEQAEADIKALVAGTTVGAERVKELCQRFGKDVYMEACDAILDRTRSGVIDLICTHLPDGKKFEFEDYADDDGLGYGPVKLKLTMYRDGEVLNFDWAGSDPQVQGPINFYLNPEMFKMFGGIFLIMAYAPNLVFNDGYYDVINVNIPEGSILRPEYPAPLSNRLVVMARHFDVLQGVFSKALDSFSVSGSYGTSPNFVYAGKDSNGMPFQTMEILYGGVPARPMGDGVDGHSWWPEFRAVSAEYMEKYYPLQINEYQANIDSGGSGEFRGGNGIKKTYTFLEDGHITFQDDRAHTYPFGVEGGKHGAPSQKLLIRKKDGSRVKLPSKVENVPVFKGDQLIFITAGSGGLGDPLKRDAEHVVKEVRRGLISKERALNGYGVVINEDETLNPAETERKRNELTNQQSGNTQLFDNGPIPEIEKLRTEIADTRRSFDAWLSDEDVSNAESAMKSGVSKE